MSLRWVSKSRPDKNNWLFRINIILKKHFYSTKNNIGYLSNPNVKFEILRNVKL